MICNRPPGRYFGEAHAAGYVEGVTLKPWRDDGSEAWAEMWERVKEKPVREMYTPPAPRL